MNVYAYLRSEALIFPAPPSSYEDDAGIIKLTTKLGDRIACYHLRATKAKKLLLYSHGNGEDIGNARDFLKNFPQHDISVIAYDYPGYGTSTGKPSEAGCYAAIETVYAYATEQLGYAPENIILYGRSLGSGSASWLAQQVPVAGLIFECAFTSTFRVLTRVKLLPWDRFNNYARLQKIKCPTLLLHGTADEIVPLSHAEKNWTAIRSKKQKLFIDGAGHNDIVEVAGRTYWDTVLPFILGENN
jgi:pimeloyl-ACP methyl ester carboxylesterase